MDIMTVSAQGIPVNTLTCTLLLGEHFGWYYYIPNSFSGSKCISYINPKNISEYLLHARYFVRCWVVWILKRHYLFYWCLYRQRKKCQFNIVSMRPFFLNLSSSYHPVWLLFLGSSALSGHSSFVPIAVFSLSVNSVHVSVLRHSIFYLLLSYSTYSPRVTSRSSSQWSIEVLLTKIYLLHPKPVFSNLLDILSFSTKSFTSLPLACCISTKAWLLTQHAPPPLLLLPTCS